MNQKWFLINQEWLHVIKISKFVNFVLFLYKDNNKKVGAEKLEAAQSDSYYISCIFIYVYTLPGESQSH